MMMTAAISAGLGLRKLGALGEMLLGAADSSLIPTPGSLDLLTIVLVAATPQNWWLYALVATAGSVIGGLLTYRIGDKGGERALESRIPARQLAQIYRWSERYTRTAIVLPSLLPPPFPLSPFLLIAGAMKLPLRQFILLFSCSRLFRFGAIALLSRRHAPWIMSIITRHSYALLIATIALVSVVSAIVYSRLRNRIVPVTSPAWRPQVAATEVFWKQPNNASKRARSEYDDSAV